MISFDHLTRSVIGVLPPRLAFMRNASLGPPQRADAYITFDTNLAETNPNAGSYAGVMRAQRGTSPQVVASAVDAVGKAIDARDFQGRGLKLYPVGLKPDLIAPIRPVLVVVGFAGVFLLLALLVNLASVLLAGRHSANTSSRCRAHWAPTAPPSCARLFSKAACSASPAAP